MVELVQYSIAFISRYKIRFWNHDGTSLFDPLTAILLTIFALFFPAAPHYFTLANMNNNQSQRKDGMHNKTTTTISTPTSNHTLAMTDNRQSMAVGAVPSCNTTQLYNNTCG
jgi:hypothetical protein